MKIIEVNQDNFNEEALKGKKKVLVDFYADWCGPCKMIKTIIEDVAENNNNVRIASVNIENEEELAEKILRCFAKENDMPVHKLVSEFLMMLDDTYFQSIYTKEDKMDSGAFTNAIYQLVDSSKTGRWLTMKFDKIVNGGGAM